MGSFELKLMASIVIVVLAIVLSVIGRRLEQKDPGLNNVLIVVALMLALWVPRAYRDLGLAVLAGLLGLIGNYAIALVAGAATYAIAMIVPGGAMAVLLVLSGIAAYWVGREERERLRDLDRAKMLVPGENRQIKVAVVGPSHADGVKHPITGSAVSAWWARIVEGGGADPVELSSDVPIEVASSDGTAKVDLSNVHIDIEELASTSVEGDEASEVAVALGHDPKERDVVVTLRWIENGTSLFVKGVPTWEAEPGAGGYRHTEFVPVFRSREDHPLTVKLGTFAEIKRRVWFSGIMWAGWAIPCIGVAALQIAFGL